MISRGRIVSIGVSLILSEDGVSSTLQSMPGDDLRVEEAVDLEPHVGCSPTVLDF